MKTVMMKVSDTYKQKFSTQNCGYFLIDIMSFYIFKQYEPRSGKPGVTKKYG